MKWKSALARCFYKSLSLADLPFPNLPSLANWSSFTVLLSLADSLSLANETVTELDVYIAIHYTIIILYLSHMVYYTSIITLYK